MWYSAKLFSSPTLSRTLSVHERNPLGVTKEYILVRERTAPPSIFQTFAHPTSPCFVCSILQLPDCLTEQAGGEVGWENVWKTQGGVVRSLTNIYSLGVTQRQYRKLFDLRHFLMKQSSLYRHLVIMIQNLTHGFDFTASHPHLAESIVRKQYNRII